MASSGCSSRRLQNTANRSGALASGGSFARGDEHEESDIDILIEFEEGGRSFDTYMDLKFLLEELFGRRVDLVDRDAIKPALAPHILRSVRYLPGVTPHTKKNPGR